MTERPGKTAKIIRGGDLIRVMWKVPGKAAGRCLDTDCTWAPAGQTPLNIGRECMKHTRKTGHVTRFAVLEIVEYRPRPGSGSGS